jgi:hypothetical protein
MRIDPDQYRKMEYFRNNLAGKFESSLDEILYEALDTWLESAGPARLEVQHKRQRAAMASAGKC